MNPVDAQGAEVRLHVVGIIRDPFDAGANGSGLFVSPAFVAQADRDGLATGGPGHLRPAP